MRKLEILESKPSFVLTRLSTNLISALVLKDIITSPVFHDSFCICRYHTLGFHTKIRRKRGYPSILIIVCLLFVYPASHLLCTKEVWALIQVSSGCKGTHPTDRNLRMQSQTRWLPQPLSVLPETNCSLQTFHQILTDRTTMSAFQSFTWLRAHLCKPSAPNICIVRWPNTTKELIMPATNCKGSI